MVDGSVLKPPPESGALGILLTQNTHEQPIKTVLLIAQGVADDLVSPDIQSRFV
jgi:hypothetical protein